MPQVLAFLPSWLWELMFLWYRPHKDHSPPHVSLGAAGEARHFLWCPNSSLQKSHALSSPSFSAPFVPNQGADEAVKCKVNTPHSEARRGVSPLVVLALCSSDREHIVSGFQSRCQLLTRSPSSLFYCPTHRVAQTVPTSSISHSSKTSRI